MHVSVIGHTRLMPINAMLATGGEWGPEEYEDEDGINAGGFIAEFAGRGCYESWRKPNPETATLDTYLQHIFDVEHLSVIEHGTVSLHFAGVSRSFTHELIRHRHFSYSQLSQRYAKLGNAKPVVPPLFQNNEPAEEIIFKAWEAAVFHYNLLLERALISAEAAGYTGTMARKRAQEAARAVLPNMAPTKIVVSGNHRSWIEFLLKRGGAAADLEIREAAFQVFHLLMGLEPAIYRNVEYVDDKPDGYLRLVKHDE